MENIKEFNTLKDLFDYSIDRYKDNKAFAYIDGLNYTYQEFGNQTIKANQLLLEFGVGDRSKIAILGQNMPNWPVAYFAATAFNRIAVPILPDFSEDEIENVLEHSESEALIVSKRLVSKISSERLAKLKVVINMDSMELINSLQSEPLKSTSNPEREELAAIIYTSGTTGNSKGVMLSHRNLCSHLYAAAVLRPSFEWDVWLSVLPLSHTMENSLSMMLPMMSGASVYYMDKAPTPSLLVQALAKTRPTTMLSVPLIIEKIYRNSVLPKFTSSPFIKAIYGTSPGRKILHRVAGKKLMKTFGGRIRFFGVGGAKLDATVERFLLEAKFPYAIGYGLTESSPLLAGAVGKWIKWQSTGPAIHGVTLRIDNPNPENGEGEIVAQGPNIMMGYYKNPEATEQAFTKDGFFRTKDLGIIDKTGRLFIKGRLSNMILGPSGENIYPEEIESVINAHPMVSESIVTNYKGKLVALVHFNPDKIKALQDMKEEAIAMYYEKKDILVHTYEETKDEATRIFNEKMEQLKREVYEYVNSRVNKFSKIALIKDIPQQFEKTATQKIKRYLYTKK
ncbi:MAG: AMP-binding protein [Bacteroidales bacterium]|jgi:long-chain acyl-CoA synthetase|nr:AMP-binding protein [Bacteroidales bacterium]